MPDREEELAAERVDRLVEDMLADRHLKVTPSDSREREAILAAARLAGAREGYPRMSPGFRRRLAGLLDSGRAPAWLSRRSALVAGLGAAAGALGGVALGRLGETREPVAGQAAHRQPPAGRGIVEPQPELAHWVETGLTLAEMAEGRPYRVTAGSVGAFVVRKGERVMAMSAYCTHLPCELAWQPASQVLNCPCHNQRFDTEGRSLSESYPLPPLPLVRVQVQDGRIQVLGTR